MTNSTLLKNEIFLSYVKNIVENGENIGYLHFSYSHVFKSPFSLGHLQSELCDNDRNTDEKDHGRVCFEQNKHIITLFIKSWAFS